MFEKSLTIPVNNNNADPIVDVSMNHPLRDKVPGYADPFTAFLFHDPEAFFPRRSGETSIKTQKHYTLACLFAQSHR